MRGDRMSGKSAAETNSEGVAENGVGWVTLSLKLAALER
jgi:hypothetical protein